MKNRFFFGAVVAAALSASTPATAALVVNTGTPAGGPDYALVPGTELAGRFTLSAATTINAVEGYINGGAGYTGTINIFGDGPKPANATLLFTATFTTILAPTPGAWQGVFGQNWALAAGNYWVGFASSGPSGMVGGAPTPLVNHAFTSGGAWFNTTPINIGARISGVPTISAPVPEPTSWAMLITGFAMVGGAMRRRVTKASYA